MIFLYNQNFFLSGRIKAYLRKILGRQNSGPNAVFDSLTHGLRVLNQDFLINSKNLSQNEIAAVLSGHEALAWAIEQKKLGKIGVLLAGPNVVYTANDFNGLIAQNEIDACLVPSEQVKVAYERYNPKLLGRIYVWYTGVNEVFWQPELGRKSAKNLLFYCKNAPQELILKAQTLAETLGFRVLKINYGHYEVEDFKEALSQSEASIFFSPTESQGIALAESWAMDVPTLVWNPKQVHPHFKDMTDSPAPFLSEATGKFWENLEELEVLLKNLQPTNFHPRQWVLENMTDQISAQKFLEIISSLKNQ